MNRNQKIIFFTGLGVVIVLIVIVVILMVQTGSSEEIVAEDTTQTTAQEQVDSLQNAYYQLELTQEYTQLEADFKQYEEQQKYLKNDSLVRRYNESKKRVESLLQELKSEKRSNSENREKIKQLQAEIATLKEIVRHYLEEIQRLSVENEGLKQELQQVSERNEQLSEKVASTSRSNEELTQTVAIAKKLNITGLTLRPSGKNGKAEKNITKAKTLTVSFSVAPNNTAAPGNKTFYVRIQNPEGEVLGGGASCSYQGQNVVCTAARTLEYNNGELSVSVSWGVTSTLTPGQYTVDVFCDGNRLGSTHVTLSK